MRWTPSAASAACLANKAIEECEEAEGYNERVRVVGGSKLAILVKPDVASTQTGEYLAPDQWLADCSSKAFYSMCFGRNITTYHAREHTASHSPPVDGKVM